MSLRVRLLQGALLAALVFSPFAGPPGAVRAGQDICSEPNDGPAGACAIGNNSSAAGYLDGPDDLDYYSIQVGEGQSVQATIANLPGNYNLRLEAADGSVVTVGEGSGTDDKSLGAFGLSGGTYYLVVYSEGGDSSASTSYTLRLSIQGAVAVNLEADPSAPAPVASSDRPLDQLVLVGDEAGEKAKQTAKTQGSDGRASWYQVTFKRDDKDNKGVDNTKFGPLLTINRVYRANDIETAQQIYREQAGAGLPEAKENNLAAFSVGPAAIPTSLGEEASALAGCANRDCSGDRVVRHFRLVFRMGNLVETMYTWGPDAGNNMNVAFDLCKRVEKRINNPPDGPPPEIFSRHQASEIGLHIADAGKQADEIFSRTGSDGRANWYEARFERGEETIAQRLGPTHLYNKVFVANSNADARAIFRENAVQDLPEATMRRGPIFEEPKTKAFGNESYAIGACNDDCNSQFSDKLHERLVYRWGNVVVILYTWGREDQSNPGDIGNRASIINQRVP